VPAPQAVPLCQDLSVAGACTKEVNGVYTLMGGKKNGAPMYAHADVPVVLSKCSSAKEWLIADRVSGSCNGGRDDFYAAKAATGARANEVPAANWDAANKGTGVGPTVTCEQKTTDLAVAQFDDKKCGILQRLTASCDKTNGCIMSKNKCRSIASLSAEAPEHTQKELTTMVDYASNKNTVVSDVPRAVETVRTMTVDYDAEDKKALESKKAGAYLVDGNTGLSPTPMTGVQTAKEAKNGVDATEVQL
jgi:hypothetical protein